MLLWSRHLPGKIRLQTCSARSVSLAPPANAVDHPVIDIADTVQWCLPGDVVQCPHA